MDEIRPVSVPQEWAEGSWLVLAYRNNPPIRLDARVLDRVLAEGQRLVLAANEFVTALHITGGMDVARKLAEDLAPYTRSALIMRREAYEADEESMRRLPILNHQLHMEASLFIGENPVRANDTHLFVGTFSRSIEDVASYASLDRALHVPDGRIQASLAMLVIADRYRPPENAAILAHRIAGLESRAQPGSALQTSSTQGVKASGSNITIHIAGSQIHVDRMWVTLDFPNNLPIRLDCRFLDRVLVDDDEIILAVGEEAFGLRIHDVCTAAQRLAERVAPYTRSAPITLREVYEDAQRRLELASRGRRDNAAFFLYFGNEDVFVKEESITIGKLRYSISDIVACAETGASLSVTGGVLPARLAMLVVAASKRSENIDVLAERVAEYKEKLL